MAFSIGVVGVGQFGGHFAHLFKLHPGVTEVYAVDERPERAAAALDQWGLDGTKASFEELLASDVDAVAIFTQRWTHGPLVEQALRAGKHVYSAVPMAVSEEEIERIIEAVKETGLIYAMGETSYYNPATVYARNQHAAGKFGRIFYSEGDYVHDMDLGFYDAYQYSGGERWKETASYPPMLYPTHAIGGVLGVLPAHAVSVSCIGVKDDRGDGVFDKDVSMFGNDFSNATALFELNDGGAMRTNEMLVLVVTVIGSFQVFDTVAVTTGGGPVNASRVIQMYIYQKAFGESDFGYASALSVILFLILALVAFVQMKFLKGNESDLD